MPATVLSRAQVGMEAPLVHVEAFLGPGLPSFTLVGLPETAVKEARERVRSAIVTAKYEFPDGRIIVNLSPADLPKEGGRFDLPIALGLLVASGQLPEGQLAGCEFFGELSLNGELRPIRGALPAVFRAANDGHRVVMPKANVAEAMIVHSGRVGGAAHLLEVCAHLKGDAPLEFCTGSAAFEGAPAADHGNLADIRGQAFARRALEVAAAGAHSILFTGPPGTGKSMLAHRLPGILPPMTEAEAFESATVASVSNRGFRLSEWGRRPFRAPHHTVSGVALVGGGSPPRPGEISLAHHGVLFLDELAEFERRVLEVLREPLETGRIVISRAARQEEFPARFLLVAAMNPCPCGYLGMPDGRCHCSPLQISRYRSRVSGPLLDRIDLQVEVPPVDAAVLASEAEGEASDAVLTRTTRAREAQLNRGHGPNGILVTRQIEQHCRMQPAARLLLERSVRKLGLSARACHRVRKVARTLADLEGREVLGVRQVAEAIQLRRGAV